jgi:hypothetical protein
MLNITTLHIIKNPAGTYSYVGRVPVTLMRLADANRSDILGCRAFKADDGSMKVYKGRTFQTYDEALQYAKSHGFEVVS